MMWARPGDRVHIFYNKRAYRRVGLQADSRQLYRRHRRPIGSTTNRMRPGDRVHILYKRRITRLIRA